MGEATQGEGFSSSLVYALIKISACGTIVRVKPEKISTGGDNFYTTICSQCVPEESNVLRRYVNLFFCSLFDLLRDLVCMGMQCT